MSSSLALQKGSTKILCNNKSTIALIKNMMFHGRSKYISIKFHYIREVVKNENIKFEFCRSKFEVANIFIKSLKTDVFKNLKMMLDVIDFATHIKGGC